MTMTKIKTLRIAMLAMGMAIGICGGNAVKADISTSHAAPAAIEHAAPLAYTQTSDVSVDTDTGEVLAVVDNL